MSSSSDDFITFLTCHGYLAEVDAARVREVVANDTVPLGKVLVMSGAMSIKAVMQVLAAQSEHPGVRFGAVAMRLGFITPEQLGEALRRQSQVRVHPAQVVLDLELLDETRWRNAMVEYCRLIETGRAA